MDAMKKEWNTYCYNNKSSDSNRQVMSLLKKKETTTHIKKDVMDNKRMQLEMKKNATNSFSSAMLMVTRNLMCAEVVVEKQQTRIHQIQKNIKRSICSVVKRFDVRGNPAMAY